MAGKRKKSKLCSQKGEVPPGAETADIEGWEPLWANFSARLMLGTGEVPKRVAKGIKTAFICRGE